MHLIIKSATKIKTTFIYFLFLQFGYPIFNTYIISGLGHPLSLSRRTKDYIFRLVPDTALVPMSWIPVIVRSYPFAQHGLIYCLTGFCPQYHGKKTVDFFTPAWRYEGTQVGCSESPGWYPKDSDSGEHPGVQHITHELEISFWTKLLYRPG